MLLPRFDYHEPGSIREACDLMAEMGEKARPLAGGTDLLVNMKKRVLSPEHLISLSRIDELRSLDTSNGQIQLGACVTAAELAGSQMVRKDLSALAQGAGWLGSPLIRNLATLAGNLVSARPAADLPPSLMAYGATAILKSRSAERTVPLEALFKGPGETVIRVDEILTAVVVDRPAPGAGAGYIKLGTRKALEISLANVAAFLSLEEDGRIGSARVFLGAVAPTPIRAPSAEAVLKGEKADEALFARAGEAAAGDSRPIDDFRGSAEYRRAMVAVLTKRALRMAYARAHR
jgi:carbon-monoxide dehydrogenase medium subunit